MIRDYGDRALLIDCDSTSAVAALAAALREGRLPGVVDIVPGARTVLVTVAEANALASVRTRLTGYPVASPAPPPAPGAADVVIDVVYDGPDLAEVAQRTHLSPEEVVRLHQGAEYLVYMLGFSPGFAYMGGLPKELMLPRKSVPRTAVPAGSVGIANNQSCIYPQATPGGWNLIGRTPLSLFDPRRDPPVRLRAGDRVRFKGITPEAFATWEDQPWA